MSAQLAVHKAAFDLLRADAALKALLGVDPNGGSPSLAAVFDHVPQAAESEDATAFPLVVIGETTATEFDTDQVSGQETTLTIHVHDLYRGRKRVKQILDALYNALHDVPFSVTGHVLVYCYWEFSQVLQEDGPKSQHAVTRFRIVTQES